MTAGLPTASSTKSGGAQGQPNSSRGWWIAAALVLLPALIPPISLLWQVLTKGTGTTVPFERLLELFVGTLLLLIAVTLTSLTIGTVTAWLTTRTDIPARRAWMVAAALPLVVPSYMAALTIIGATGPAGLIASWFGIVIPTPYGFLGAWLALSIFLAPMAYLIVSPALRQIDPATEEAATGLGANRIRVLGTVTIPQLRPALVSAGLMVGLYTISDFGAVSLLRYDTFTRAIFTLYEGQIDRRPAAALSLVLMVLALSILFVERRTRTRAAYGTLAPKRRRTPIQLNLWGKLTGVGFLSAYATLALAIPLAVLVFWLFRGVEAGADMGSVWAEAFRSVGVSIVAALLAAAASLPVAMVTTWKEGRFSSLVESSVWATYSLPHITVGVAVVAFALAWARPLYQTLLLLVVVYVGMFMAQSVSTVQDLLRRTSHHLEEASRGLGRGSWFTLRRITIPIASSGLMAGAALVFLSVMKELPATLLLRPNGFETLAIRIWSSTGEGFYTRASVAGLVLLAVSIVPLLVLTYRDLSD
jgi:iron(III) transport system permease protein